MTNSRVSPHQLRRVPAGPPGGPIGRTAARREGGLFVWAEYVVLVRVGEEEGAELSRLLDEDGRPWEAGGESARSRAFLAALQAADAPGIRRLGRPADGAMGLTFREVEVLRLIARGKSNQQIADELVISTHTVARHVSNIFDKTGAANRAEAAVFAARNGLA